MVCVKVCVFLYCTKFAVRKVVEVASLVAVVVVKVVGKVEVGGCREGNGGAGCCW